MKTRRFIVTLFVVAVALAPQLLRTSTAAPAGSQQGGYSAQLISPTAGEVLYPGQKVRVEWRSVLPHVDLAGCEMEVFLSLDGGKSFPMVITPLLDPKATFFYWTVPNMPSNAVVLDIRFGCEGWYPESYSPQTASTFVIAQNAGQFY
jgi:hypothetical protein